MGPIKSLMCRRQFIGSAERFFVIGDCSCDGDIVRISEGNVRTSQRTAFSAASQI